jgi:hypothetical protein
MAAVLCHVVACGESDRESTFIAKKTKERSPAYMLASLDAGYTIADTDPAVAKYRALLSRLGKKYVETPSQIGDMTVTSQASLKEAGISVSLFDVMEGMDQLFSRPLGNQSYAEYAAAYGS